VPSAAMAHSSKLGFCGSYLNEGRSVESSARHGYSGRSPNRHIPTLEDERVPLSLFATFQARNDDPCGFDKRGGSIDARLDVKAVAQSPDCRRRWSLCQVIRRRASRPSIPEAPRSLRRNTHLSEGARPLFGPDVLKMGGSPLRRTKRIAAGVAARIQRRVLRPRQARLARRWSIRSWVATR